MTFHVNGDDLDGNGISMDVAAILATSSERDDRAKRLVEIAEVTYLQGWTAAAVAADDRFDLHYAVDVLRALSVIVGPDAREKHRRAADIIAQMLLDLENGP